MSLLSDQSSLKISVLQRGKLTEEIAVVRLSLMDILQAPANIQDVREVKKIRFLFISFLI